MEIQAPGFYRKQGYEAAAILDCDPPGITRMRLHHLMGQPRAQRWFPLRTGMVGGLKPVPATGRIGRGRLGRIGNKEGVPLRKGVHLGTGSEIRGCLRTAMEHDQQRRRLTRLAAWDIEPVGTGPGWAGV